MATGTRYTRTFRPSSPGKRGEFVSTTIDDDIMKALRDRPYYFNELCRHLHHRGIKNIHIALIKLEKQGKIKSEMIQSAFETHLRWVRQYSIVI